MLIILTSLVSMNKIQKNFCFSGENVMWQRYYVMPVIWTCDIYFDLLLSDQIFAFLNAKNNFLADERVRIIDLYSLTRECSEINVVVLSCLQCHFSGKSFCSARSTSFEEKYGFYGGKNSAKCWRYVNSSSKKYWYCPLADIWRTSHLQLRTSRLED